MADNIIIRVKYGSLLEQDVTIECGHEWASIECGCEVVYHPSGVGEPIAACVLTEVLRKISAITQLPSSLSWRATLDPTAPDIMHDYDVYTLERMFRCYIEHMVYFKKPLDAIVVIREK